MEKSNKGNKVRKTIIDNSIVLCFLFKSLSQWGFDTCIKPPWWHLWLRHQARQSLQPAATTLVDWWITSYTHSPIISTEIHNICK